MDIRTVIHPATLALVLSGMGSPLAAGPFTPTTLWSFAQSSLIDELFRVLLTLAAIVFLAVEGALVYAVFRFRRSQEDRSAASISPHPGLEIIWTLIPAVLVIVIAIFSFRALAAQPSGPNGGEAAPSQDTAEAGRGVFMTYGCSACHTLKAVGAKGTVGPSLDGVGSWAGALEPGLDAGTFLHQAVLDPDEHIASGYESGIMPANFATRLSPAQLSGLVKFLMAQK